MAYPAVHQAVQAARAGSPSGPRQPRQPVQATYGSPGGRLQVETENERCKRN